MTNPVILDQPFIWSNDGQQCVLRVHGLMHDGVQGQVTKLKDSLALLVVWNVTSGKFAKSYEYMY